MKRVLTLLVLLIGLSLALSPLFSGVQGHAQRDQGKFRRSQKAIPNQYVVVLKDEVAKEDVPARASQLALAHGSVPRFIYQHAIKGFSVQLPEAAALALSKNPLVEYVVEDGQVQATTTQTN